MEFKAITQEEINEHKLYYERVYTRPFSIINRNGFIVHLGPKYRDLKSYVIKELTRTRVYDMWLDDVIIDKETGVKGLKIKIKCWVETEINKFKL